MKEICEKLGTCGTNFVDYSLRKFWAVKRNSRKILEKLSGNLRESWDKF